MNPVTPYHNVHVSRQTFDISAATVSPTFELLNNASLAYNSAITAGTLQVSFDNGTSWEDVASSTAGVAWSVISLPVAYKGFCNSGRLFRVEWASAFTGTLLVGSNNG